MVQLLYMTNAESFEWEFTVTFSKSFTEIFMRSFAETVKGLHD